MDITEITLGIIGALGTGGFLGRLLFRSDRRSAEFRSLKEYNEFLQVELRGKEERFIEQTQLVRKLNDECIRLTRANGELELRLLASRCDRRDCREREPPFA